MRINKAAISYGIVTFCVGITCGVLGKFLPDFVPYFVVPILSFFGAMISAASIDLMSEIKD